MNTHELRRLLERVPAVHAQLGDALVPSGSSPDGERVTGGGGDSRPAPARLEVAEHRNELLRGLRWWCAHTTAAATRPTMGDSPARMCAWLIAHMFTLDRGQHTELGDNLETWLRRARKLAADERPARLVPLPAGCLTETTELWECVGTLALAIPQRGREGTPELRCSECRASFPVTELPAAANVQLGVADAAALLGMSVRTVQRRAPRDAGTVRLSDLLTA